MAIQIVRVDSRSGLELLQAEWEELQADSQSQSIFLSWEWVNAYLQYLNPAAELWVLLARDDAQGLLGVAPLMVEKVHIAGPLRERRLQFIALEFDKHYTGFIIRKGCEEAVTAAFIRWLRQHRAWDEVLLEGVPAESPVTNALVHSGPHWISLDSNEYPYIRITTTWEQHFASLSKSKRKSQRHAWHRLDADFPDQWSWKRIEDPAELPAAMDKHMDLHQKQWVAHGQVGHYDNEQVRAFHHHIARRFLERGWLRLYQMTIQDEVVGVDYKFAYLDTLFAYGKAMDPAYKEYSVGNLMAEVGLREAFAAGMKEYDFLWGTHEHKLHWGPTIRRTIVLSWPITPTMFLYRHGYQVAHQIWITAKHWIRMDKRAWAHAMLDRLAPHHL